MNFTIITHVPHNYQQGSYFAYGPYVREMNIWLKYADEITIVAPFENYRISAIDEKYKHEKISFRKVKSFDVIGVQSAIKSAFKLPGISIAIFQAMRQADHIHLRCPGNMGLLGCIVQLFFPSKPKTAKYAGNWDPFSKQPLTYRLQKWILSNTFLTRNMQVLVYGKWGENANVRPFFTATYQEFEKDELLGKKINDTINFIFSGGLVSGKNPLYAIQLVAKLHESNKNVQLGLYGEGAMRAELDDYIAKNNLSGFVTIYGNQSRETLKQAYQHSHFVILPSESEGWPKAIAEGMFWGCVPLATPVSCVSFMLDYGKRGVLLQMDTEKDARSVLEIIASQTDFTAKSIDSQTWSQNYTLDIFENEIRKLIKT